MKRVKSLIGVLLVLVALGAVTGIVTPTMSKKDLQETVADNGISIR